MYILTINKGKPTQNILIFDTRGKLKDFLSLMLFAEGIEGDTYQIKNTQQGYTAQVTKHNFDFAIRRLH